MGMNPRQKRFADLYLQGMPAGAAYTQAGYNSTGGAADVCGCKLLKNAKIKDYFKTMNEKTDKSTILSITERKELLTRIALRQEGESPSDAIRASAELSKMDGAYEPQKQEVNTRIIIGGDAE
jgi:phage terminase small subunit